MSKRLTACLLSSVFACALAPTPQQAGTPFVITGQVVDAAGEPIPGAGVCAVRDNIAPGERLPCAKTSPRGEFRLTTGRAGSYKVFAEKADACRMSQFMPFYRHPTLVPPSATVNEANPAQHVRVEIVPPSGVVAGRLIDEPTGRPVEGAQISLCLAGEPTACIRRSAKRADGRFSLPAAYLPFTAEITAGGYETWRAPGDGVEAAPLAVAPGETLELDARLKRRAGTLLESEKRPGIHLTAPAQLAPDANTIFDHFPRHTRLVWSPVAGAVAYAVEIDYCQPSRDGGPDCLEPQSLFLSMRQEAQPSPITGTSYEFLFVGAQPGRWRVWAVDAEGREGFKSGWRRFVYLK